MHFRDRTKGATLIELIFVLLIMGIVVTVSLGTVHRNARWFSASFQEALTTTEWNAFYRIACRDFSFVKRSQLYFWNSRLVILRKPFSHWVIYWQWGHRLYRNGDLVLSNIPPGGVFRFLNASGALTWKRRQVRYIQLQFQSSNFIHRWQWSERFYVQD